MLKYGDQMKHLFLSSSSGYSWNQIKTWNLSARKTGHDVCNLLLNGADDLVNSCKQNGVGAVSYNLPQASKSPHNMRFLAQYKYLMSVAEKYDQVVLTDSRDVYFHSDPFPVIQEHLNRHLVKCLCGSESISYQDEHWGKKNLTRGYGYVYDEYKNREICNVGVICGDVLSVAELCLLIFTMSVNNPARVSDQSSFNILMGTGFISSKVHISRPSEGLIVHLGTVGVEEFRGKLLEKPMWPDGELPSVNGKVFPIIHQYDRIPKIQSLIGS